MHDPMVVAFDILRPWPQRSGLPASGIPGERWRVLLHHVHHEECAAEGCDPARNPFPWWKTRSWSRFWRLAGRDYYWPALITIWHREPGGHDSGEICPQTRRAWNEAERKWEYRATRRWRFHVRHWKIQVHPLQQLRRRLLTRCAWCHGRQRKGDVVNISHSWDGPRGRGWYGEPGLFHHDCSSAEHASRMCLCAVPVLDGHGGYGTCAACGKFRGYGSVPDDADRMLAALPAGSRIPADVRPRLEELWAERRARREADR
jgi:hypothetical protein